MSKKRNLKLISGIVLFLISFGIFGYLFFAQQSIFAGIECVTQSVSTLESSARQSCNAFESQGYDCEVIYKEYTNYKGETSDRFLACANTKGEIPQTCIKGFDADSTLTCNNGDLYRLYIDSDCSLDWKLSVQCPDGGSCRDNTCYKPSEVVTCYKCQGTTLLYKTEEILINGKCSDDYTQTILDCSSNEILDEEKTSIITKILSDGKVSKTETETVPANVELEKAPECFSNLNCNEGEVCINTVCENTEEIDGFFHQYGIPLLVGSIALVFAVILLLPKKKKKGRK